MHDSSGNYSQFVGSRAIYRLSEELRCIALNPDKIGAEVRNS